MKLSERYSIIELNLQEFVSSCSFLARCLHLHKDSDTELCILLSSLLFFDPGGFSWDVLPLFPCGLFLPLAMMVEAPLAGAGMVQ